MDLKKLPHKGVLLTHKKTKRKWEVIESSGQYALLGAQDEDSWEVDLYFLNENFEASIPPVMYHQVMDRAAMLTDIFERWCSDPVQTHPQLRAEAEATLARLIAFYDTASSICSKIDEATD